MEVRPTERSSFHATVAGLPCAATCAFEGPEAATPENVARLSAWIVERGYEGAPAYRLVILPAL